MELLFLAAARDGSTSLRQLICRILELNGILPDAQIPDAFRGKIPSFSVGYVSNTFPLWPALIDYIKSGNSAELFEILDDWKHKIEVSHGLIFMLPVVRVAFGRKLKIVRIVRERRSHVESLVKRVRINPTHWGGYSDLAEGIEIPRPTAVDFGEMAKKRWDRLTTAERFGWYLGKQDELFRRDRGLFDTVSTIRTEELSNPGMVRRIADLVDPSLKNLPAPVHIHKTSEFDVSKASGDELKRIEEIWEQIDYVRALRDEAYPLQFFFDMFMKRHGTAPDKNDAILKEIARRLAAAGIDSDQERD
ncbi:MAG: hypothetical protein HY059_17755 [Proteobacteria bacterium]|nr:hypothetical protein [Pseudomonadota bacterium]